MTQVAGKTHNRIKHQSVQQTCGCGQECSSVVDDFRQIHQRVFIQQTYQQLPYRRLRIFRQGFQGFSAGFLGKASSWSRGVFRPLGHGHLDTHLLRSSCHLNTSLLYAPAPSFISTRTCPCSTLPLSPGNLKKVTRKTRTFGGKSLGDHMAAPGRLHC